MLTDWEVSVLTKRSLLGSVPVVPVTDRVRFLSEDSGLCLRSLTALWVGTRGVCEIWGGLWEKSSVWDQEVSAGVSVGVKMESAVCEGPVGRLGGFSV